MPCVGVDAIQCGLHKEGATSRGWVISLGPAVLLSS